MPEHVVIPHNPPHKVYHKNHSLANIFDVLGVCKRCCYMVGKRFLFFRLKWGDKI